MHSILRYKSPAHRLLSLAAIAASLPLVPAAHAATFTWDGGGANGNTSTADNWSTNVAPGATGDNLVFAGTTNLNVSNDSIISLSTSTAGSITFASGAGSFNIGGNAITVGNSAGSGLNIIQQSSANDQTISANLNFTGGGGDRTILFASGAGSLTLSGAINVASDWLFPTTVSSSPAGTIKLTGSVSGNGKSAITAGTNSLFAVMRNNVAGTNLVLGTTTLGNAATGNIADNNAVLRGIIANQQLNLSTNGADLNLSGYTLAINASNITFNGANNLTVGNIIAAAGNRDFVVSSSGRVNVATGLFTSGDQTARSLYLNLSGAGGMVVDGKLYNTLHSGGVTTTVNDTTATATTGILRKAGTGTLTLNGDSGTTFTGTIQIEAGTLKIGHANALGSTTGATVLAANGTLDLNGQSIGETIKITGNSSLINSSSSAATVSADSPLTGNLAVNATGDITLSRLIGSGATRTVTKTGAGTLTTNGANHNNLVAWDIQGGTVVLANTAGFGADRGVTIGSGGTLRLSGPNTDLINDTQAFVLGGGTFDLNGKSESVGAMTLNSATTSFIDFGAGGSVFLVSSISGTGLLNILNLTEGSDSFRVTADPTSLLGQIKINGLDALATNMGSYYEITAAIPEPSAFAAFAGLGALGFVASRRRRRA